MNALEVQQLVTFGFLPDSRPVHRLNLDSTLYRAVALVRVALRRKDTSPQELARCACRLLGIGQVETVARLACAAEDACRRARMALRDRDG